MVCCPQKIQLISLRGKENTALYFLCLFFCHRPEFFTIEPVSLFLPILYGLGHNGNLALLFLLAMKHMHRVGCHGHKDDAQNTNDCRKASNLA